MNWTTKNEKLRTELNFATMLELTDFLRKLASEIDRVNHHPDFKIQHTTLSIELYSYDEKKITQKDYQMAKFIDEVYLNTVN
jgi:4a-hydroxytetrahydrobiopterin dehydratase